MPIHQSRERFRIMRRDKAAQKRFIIDCGVVPFDFPRHVHPILPRATILGMKNLLSGQSVEWENK
jgi:hypothetical protein